MIQPLPPLLFTLGLLASLLPVPAAQAAPLILSPCRLEGPAQVQVVAAECGVLSVAENPADPGGRRIHLRVARVAAVNRRKQPDPLFVLAGGPGMAATTFYASIAPAFERVRRDRDIVLVDQRGTGESNPLTCAQDDNDLYRATDAEITADAKRCLTALSDKARVEFYTTSVAVQDLDHAREALGYGQINVYGVSYGTRVAQHYAKRFPASVRTLVLDGVVPPQLALGPAIALNAERALTEILARCTREPACHERFGDPAVAYRSLRASLLRQAAAVSLPDPTTGEPAHLDFTGFHLATVLRLASYTSEQAALLPVMLRSADTGDFKPLASQFLMVNRSYGDTVAYGMHNSVVCSEDVPFYDLTTVNRAQLAATYLGTTQLDGLRSICSVWPHGPVDSDFHAPLRTETPVLLLSGSTDPVTPPTDAERAKVEMKHSLHVVMEGFGHGQITAPCVDRVMANFIGRASVDGLDTSCLRADKPMPFFLTTGGPSP